MGSVVIDHVKQFFSFLVYLFHNFSSKIKQNFPKSRTIITPFLGYFLEALIEATSYDVKLY